MRKFLVLGLAAAFMTACTETPTQPLDVEAQFGLKNDNGAMVWVGGDRVAECGGWYYYTYCYDYTYTVNRVMTPSGNYKYTYNEHGMQTVTYSWGQEYTSDWKYKSNWLIKDGDLHRRTWKSDQVYEDNYYICTYTNSYHFANGKVTKSISDNVCEPK